MHRCVKRCILTSSRQNTHVRLNRMFAWHKDHQQHFIHDLDYALLRHLQRIGPGSSFCPQMPLRHNQLSVEQTPTRSSADGIVT
jgi:hypothetical protein